MLRNASGHAPCVAFSQTVDVFFKVRPAISEASGDGLTLPSRCETHLAGSSVERTGGKRVVPLVAIDRAVVGFAPGPSFEAQGANEEWWSQTGSNRRPHACKARALPTELWPLLRACGASQGCALFAVNTETKRRPT
jgi:hypothetical protein